MNLELYTDAAVATDVPESNLRRGDTIAETSVPEAALPFAQTQANFYAAARDGLRAEIVWLDGKTVAMRELLLRELLPLARRGLEKREFDRADIARYLGIIESRVASGQTGAAWQRAHVARHGPDMQALTCAYRERQRSGAPVHEWSV